MPNFVGTETGRVAIGLAVMVMALVMAFFPEGSWARTDSGTVFWIALTLVGRELGTTVKLPGVFGSIVDAATEKKPQPQDSSLSAVEKPDRRG